MEENIFPSGAVAPILEENYIEARLHIDGDKNRERILELQQELTQSISNPYYVLQDPELLETLNKLGGLTTESKFEDFLNEALSKHTKVIKSARR